MLKNLQQKDLSNLKLKDQIWCNQALKFRPASLK